MRFERNETQAMLAQSAGRLAADAPSGGHLAAALSEMGFRGVTMPEDHGGFGGDMSDAAVIFEEFGRGDLCDASVLNAVLCGPVLEAAGQGDLLPAIIADEEQIALAVHEPGRGYEEMPEAVRLDGARLTGTKCAVIGGDTATGFLVSGHSNSGPCLCLVPADAKGLTRRSYIMPDGRGAATLRFDGAAAEPLELDARGQIRAALDRGALAIAAEAQGAMGAALEITIEHLTTRQQFGRPLSKFQVLQARVADMAIAREQARSGLLAALEHADPAAVSAAKVLSDKAALIMGEGAVQLHGAIGITEEHRIGHLFRRLTAGRAMFGDRRHHLIRFSQLSDRETAA